MVATAAAKTRVKHVTGELRSFRALILGDTGTGKTTFATNCHSEEGKSLILATDANYGSVPGDRYVIDLPDWRTFESVASNENFDDYDTVAVDTVGMLAYLCQQHVCKAMGFEHPSEGKHGIVWQQLGITFGACVTRLETRAKNVLWLAHEHSVEVQVTKFKKTVKVVADIPTTCKRRIARATNITGRIELDDAGRFLNCTPSEGQEGKDTAAIFREEGGRFPLDGRYFYNKIIGGKA